MEKRIEKISPHMWNMKQHILALANMVFNRKISPADALYVIRGMCADYISLHLKNIYAEKELDESATAEDFSVVQISVI